MKGGDGKACKRCGEVKALEAFHRRSRATDGRQSICKVCRSALDRARIRSSAAVREFAALSRERVRRRNRRWLRAYLKAHACVDCGETDIRVLEFDHVRGDKTCEVSALLAGNLERLQAEVAKCDVRCGNCHRIKTAREGNWWMYRLIQEATQDQEPSP